MRRSIAALLLAVSLAGCGDRADLPLAAGYDPAPVLPKPSDPLVSTANIAPAQGWPAGHAPSPAPGLSVTAFATDLEHPRWLHVLPNGDVLAAETAAPPQPKLGKGFIMKRLMEEAGAAVPSADRITLLRDTNRDGVAELRTTFIDGLTSPFGMAWRWSDRTSTSPIPTR